jgi:hypothetical protein
VWEGKISKLIKPFTEDGLAPLKETLTYGSNYPISKCLKVTVMDPALPVRTLATGEQ